MRHISGLHSSGLQWQNRITLKKQQYSGEEHKLDPHTACTLNPTLPLKCIRLTNLFNLCEPVSLSVKWETDNVSHLTELFQLLQCDHMPTPLRGVWPTRSISLPQRSLRSLCLQISHKQDSRVAATKRNVGITWKVEEKEKSWSPSVMVRRSCIRYRSEMSSISRLLPASLLLWWHVWWWLWVALLPVASSSSESQIQFSFSLPRSASWFYKCNIL